MTQNVKHYPCFIHGKWVNASNGKTFDVIDPADEQVWATVPDCTKQDVEQALESAKQAQVGWQMLPAIERGRYLLKLVDVLKPKREYFSELLVKEQGKTLAQAYGEFDDTLNYLTYAAEAARRLHGEIVPSDTEKEQIFINRVPYGVTLGLCAYNYPLALIGRKVGPALVTGNTMVLKAHEATPVTASEFCKAVEEAGIPAGVINLVSGAGIDVSSQLVTHPYTRLVSLTGSTRAGQAIYKASSENVSGLVLELGGKAAFIVLADADIDKAAEAAVASRYANCGQVCICNELVLVDEAVAQEFTQKVLEHVKKIRVGHPMTDADMGPSVTQAGLDRVSKMIQESVEMGAKIDIGGGRPVGEQFEKGHWFEPTVLTNVTAEMPVAAEELFAPVMPIIKVNGLEHALEIANNREDGLSSYIYTQNVNSIMHTISHLEVGTVFVNRPITGVVQGYHSGQKRSGTAGEDGIHGIENYLQKRVVYWSYE